MRGQAALVALIPQLELVLHRAPDALEDPRIYLHPGLFKSLVGAGGGILPWVLPNHYVCRARYLLPVLNQQPKQLKEQLRRVFHVEDVQILSYIIASRVDPLELKRLDRIAAAP